MHPLLIVAAVLGALAAIVALILSLPVVIFVRAESAQPLSLRYRLGPIPFREKAPGEPAGPVGTLLRKILGLAPLRDVQSAQKAVRSRGVGATIVQLVRAMQTLLAAIGALLPEVRLKKLRLRAVCAGEDAAEVAMHYGAACAAVYPAVGYLETVMKTRPNAADVQITCDFVAAEGNYAFCAELRISLFRIFRAAVRLIRENMENEVYSPPVKEERNGTRSETQ